MTGTSLNRRRRQISVALIPVLLGVLLAACGDDKPPTRPTPTNPNALAVTAVTIAGTASIPPGASAP